MSYYQNISLIIIIELIKDRISLFPPHIQHFRKLCTRVAHSRMSFRRSWMKQKQTEKEDASAMDNGMREKDDQQLLSNRRGT